MRVEDTVTRKMNFVVENSETNVLKAPLSLSKHSPISEKPKVYMTFCYKTCEKPGDLTQ